MISAWESGWYFSVPAHYPSQNSCHVGFYSQNSLRMLRILVGAGTLIVSVAKLLWKLIQLLWQKIIFWSLPGRPDRQLCYHTKTSLGCKQSSSKKLKWLSLKPSAPTQSSSPTCSFLSLSLIFFLFLFLCPTFISPTPSIKYYKP